MGFNTGAVVSLRNFLNGHLKRDLFPYRPEPVWPMPTPAQCVFYHAIDLPNGESIDGAWDIRGGFEQYIGNYPIAGKAVLDVGTASGFLAFEAEKAGAIVTATDASDATDIRHIQFYDTPFHDSRERWFADYNNFLAQLKNSFWYAHHKLNSSVEVVYAPIEAYPFWGRTFDVVIAGAILEHLSDPVTSIGNMAALAKETVIIPFTPIEMTDEQTMRTSNDWTSRQYCYTWWTLSLGLYKRIFDNLGFDVEIVAATARTGGATAERHTIIAKRRKA